ncbi:reverse transcriptase [Cucumis melo var. makuwa]|uniref:Reverse transcriptase n=1 Tax=Cucumis melo var. makuwa TaxID=1194695 RepID=A0A5A7UA31_CUCMM|nr:reverse transcriptase [Cucumis melo var. makuwa]TYK04521.1 reverse transcriptase [Cucumis melo var. makuwa]
MKAMNSEALSIVGIETGTIPTETQKVLNEYVDLMSLELPKTQPLRRGIDHEIELVPRIKPPTKNAYRMAPPELAGLRK